MKTKVLSDPQTNRLMRFEVSDDFTEVSGRTDIVDDVPYKVAASDHPFGGPGAHNGGRVRFNPGDGFLYLTTGDNHNGEVPQCPTLMGSKVLRIDTDGNAAPDDAPPEGFDPRTYTYGHRNVQGIASIRDERGVPESASSGATGTATSSSASWASASAARRSGSGSTSSNCRTTARR